MYEDYGNYDYNNYGNYDYEDYGNYENYVQDVQSLATGYIQTLATTTDISNCYATYPNNPLALTNCIRAAFGLPPVTAGTIPTVDNNTLACIQAILSKYPGTPGTTAPVQLPFQTVLTMVNEIRACLGLPAVPIRPLLTCIMTNCLVGLTPGSSPSDISTCVNNCITANQV